VGGIRPPDFKTYFIATVIKAVLWQTDRHRPVEQNREPRIDTQIYPADFGKGAKAVLRMKDSLFNNWCWKKWTSWAKTKEKESHIKN